MYNRLGAALTKSVTMLERPVAGGRSPKFFEEKTFVVTELAYKGPYPIQS